MIELQEAPAEPEAKASASASQKARKSRRASTVSTKISNLINNISHSAGRQTLREAEEQTMQIFTAMDLVSTDKVLSSAPVEQVDGVIRIKGVYKHQVLKVGLRAMDESWPEGDLYTFPPKKLFREAVVRGLMDGSLKVQSVPRNDVATMQRDLRELSLRQLLKLRVRNLDYKPSGAGTDTTSTLGQAQEVFVRGMDAKLLRLLGQTVVPGQFDDEDDVVYRLGLESVLFYAALSSFKEYNLEAPTPWWCWVLGADSTSKVYLDPREYTTREDFPPEGVLMVNDLSRPDKNEPTGNLIWHEWAIEHVKEEEGLKDVEPLGGKMARARAQSDAEKNVSTGHGLDLETVTNALASLRSVSSLATSAKSRQSAHFFKNTASTTGEPQSRKSRKSNKSLGSQLPRGKTEPCIGAADDPTKALKELEEEHPHAPDMPFAPPPRPSARSLKSAKSVQIHTEHTVVTMTPGQSFGMREPNPTAPAKSSLKRRSGGAGGNSVKL